MNAIISITGHSNVRAIRTALRLVQEGQNKWVEGTMQLSLALVAARAEYSSNEVFSNWLDENIGDEINHQDRSALLKFGEYPEIAREVLEQTKRISWRFIYENEFKPRIDALTESNNVARVTSTGNTTTTESHGEMSAHLRPINRVGKKSKLYGLPRANEIATLYDAHSTRALLGKIAHKRVDNAIYKTVWHLACAAYDAGFIQKNSYSANQANTRPHLRMIFPECKSHYCTRFHLDNSKDLRLIAAYILPAMIANKDELLSDPDKIENLVESSLKTKRQELQQNPESQKVIVQKTEQPKEIPTESIIMYGVQLWPRTDYRLGEYNYDQVRVAIWYFCAHRDWFSNMPDTMGKSPKSWAIYIRLGISNMREYAVRSKLSDMNQVFQLIDALCQLYEENPNGECVSPPTPSVVGHW